MNSHRLKILLFIDEAKIGGGQQHLLWLAKYLDNSKFEVEVACEHEGYLVDELKKINIKVHPIRISNRFSISALIRTYRIIKKVSPEILHTHGGTAGFYGRLASAFGFHGAVIHTYHGIHYLNFEKSFLKKLFKLIDQFLLRYTDCTICVAESDYNDGLNAAIVKKEKAIVIHNGIDVTKFTNIDNKSDYKIKLKSDEDTLIIGSIGRLHHQKGYEYLINASKEILNKFPKVKFVLIGDGELRNDLEISAKKNGVYNSFVFLGNQTEIPKLLAQFDLFVLPSLWEGLPIVLLEAMSAKKPIVATDVNGTAELIENEVDGILVPPKDSDALTSALLRLLNDKRLSMKLAENGFNKVNKEYNLISMVNKTEALYLEQLKKKMGNV